jgi:hypothetical protein
MGIILGALGGAGEAAQNIGSTMLKNELDTESRLKVNQQDSDLALQRAKALEDYKLAAANQQRQAQSQRIQDAQTGIVNSKIGDKYASSDAAVAAADAGQTDAPLTDEQRGIINQAKDADRKKLMADKSTYVDAAIQTGDIAPKDVLAASNKEEVAGIRAQALQAVQDAKNDVWREKIEFMAQKSKDDNNTRMLIAAMRAASGGKDGGDTAKIRTAQTYLETVNAERKASGQDPMTFEEAYAIANYAPKSDQESGIRARVATTLINNDPKLLKDPEALRKNVEATLSVINNDTPAAKPPAPAASASTKKPPLNSFLK